LKKKAISIVSTVLLNDKKNAVSIALKNILAISKACRIYIFKNFFDSDNDLCMKQIHEICAEGIKPEIDNPVLQKASYKNDGFIRWKNTLQKNKMIIGNVRDFPDNERNILQPQQIKSILILPIQANNQWFGFIGFDYTKNEKSWSNRDIELLKTASEILGAYFQNHNNLMQIRNKNNELEKANKNKDRFIQILAHDLKNPFNNLIGFAELLEKNIDKYDKEKIRKFVSIINEVSNNTYNLLYDLLLWSKSQLEKLDFKPEKINFREICSEVFSELQHLSAEKNIKIDCLVNKDVLIHADINITKTILRNLITNAIKFTHKNGVVKIYTELTAKQAIVIVSDSGIGIIKEDIKKIWDNTNPYTTQGTNNEQGTGLGLILCKELIEKHGGKIWVESQIGKGSDFKFTFDN
jgi:signal transduction histidine kinase